jgi:hypothetical protein
MIDIPLRHYFPYDRRQPRRPRQLRRLRLLLIRFLIHRRNRV